VLDQVIEVAAAMRTKSFHTRVRVELVEH